MNMIQTDILKNGVKINKLNDNIFQPSPNEFKTQKSILTSLINVLIRLLYLAFIISGIFISLVSAFIEYEMLSKLFSKMSHWVLPFVIAVTFEIVKIFLHFLSTKLKTEIHQKQRMGFSLLKYFLILVSIFASLLYASRNLQNPSFETNFKKELQLFENLYQNKIQNIEKEKKEKLQDLNSQLKIWETIINENQGVSYWNRVQYYQATQKIELFNKQKQDVISRVKKEKEVLIEKFAEQKSRKVKDLKVQLNNANASGNESIKSFLNLFYINKPFPEEVYIMMIIIFSIVISILFEVIVWAVFSFLGNNHSYIFDMHMATINHKVATKLTIEAEERDVNIKTNKLRIMAKAILAKIRKLKSNLIKKTREGK